MGKTKSSDLSGGQFLSNVNAKDPDLGALLKKIIKAVNTTANSSAISPTGLLPAPPPVEGVTVQGMQSGSTITAPSEILHWTISHTAPIQKGVNYFSEIDTSPSFSQPHIVDHGSSRTGLLSLPKQNNAGTTQTYYLRSYVQYSGSHPSKPLVLGGDNSPIGIQMTGGSKTTLLPSTGSGTASPNGTQGGAGFGKVQNRPAQGPKRNLQTITGT